MVIALKAVRQRRREAKDIIIAAKPALKWLDENSKTLQTLDKCLGEVRKAESELDNRHYLAKTDIISEILSCKDELWIEKGEEEHGT